jgi:branched-chain amino acid aminotransferase
MPEIKITHSNESRISEVDFNAIPFGKICTDHMAMADYIDGKWTNFEIKPVEPLSLHPTNMTLHYGQAIFEGMKASKAHDGTPMLMRPELHAQRFNASAHRMCMPEFPEDMFVDMIYKLVSLDRAWIPPMTGSSMYIRPFMIASDENVGVKASDTYKFMILTLPAGPYYGRPISLQTSTKYVRAVDGGVGEAKCAGNYAASLYPAKLANKEGYDQVLWLDAHEFKYVQEVGTMNIFFVIGDKVITPATSGSILKGITRRSIIELLKGKGIEVEQRALSIDEVVAAHKDGTLVEVFGTGTAALIANVQRITHDGNVMELDPARFDTSLFLKDQINGLRDGSIEDTRGWMIPITEEVMA